MVWVGVASAVGSDARSPDEGDAGADPSPPSATQDVGAATPQTAPRRRNRLRWLASRHNKPATTRAPIIQLPA